MNMVTSSGPADLDGRLLTGINVSAAVGRNPVLSPSPNESFDPQLRGLSVRDRRCEDSRRVMSICEQCGTENPEGFRFCGGCGSPLAPLDGAASDAQDRHGTVLRHDGLDSPRRGARPRGVSRRDQPLFRGVPRDDRAPRRDRREIQGRRGDGRVRDPARSEDDALRAVRAAAEIRDRLPAVADEVGVALQLRTGVNTGLVLMGEGENLAVGDAVNVAARLEQAAAPGEILLGAETLRLVRDAVEVEPLEPLDLKGKSEPVAAYRLVRVDPVAPGLARHLDAPLVGRRRELHLLEEACERTVTNAAAICSRCSAPPAWASRDWWPSCSPAWREATVLRGRCLHYGEGITFWPIIEALSRRRAGDRSSSACGGGAAIRGAVLGGAPAPRVARAERPVILHVDDLQWAEPMLLDLLDHIVDLSRGAPILVLCAARPELLEDRPSWGGGKLNATTVLLEPLDPGDSELLLEQLGDGLDPDASARVIAASEGNPLFLEEMVALARERGTVAVPSTIQALLVARLERLAAEERELLERGAVEGEVFHRLAVRALADERLAAEVELRLGGLVRKELIRPHPATLATTRRFAFATC